MRSQFIHFDGNPLEWMMIIVEKFTFFIDARCLSTRHNYPIDNLCSNLFCVRVRTLNHGCVLEVERPPAQISNSSLVIGVKRADLLGAKFVKATIRIRIRLHWNAINQMSPHTLVSSVVYDHTVAIYLIISNYSMEVNKIGFLYFITCWKSLSRAAFLHNTIKWSNYCFALNVLVVRLQLPFVSSTA